MKDNEILQFILKCSHLQTCRYMVSTEKWHHLLCVRVLFLEESQLCCFKAANVKVFFHKMKVDLTLYYIDNVKQLQYLLIWKYCGLLLKRKSLSCFILLSLLSFLSWLKSLLLSLFFPSAIPSRFFLLWSTLETLSFSSFLIFPSLSFSTFL